MTVSIIKQDLQNLLNTYRNQPFIIDHYNLEAGAIDEYDSEKYHSYLDFYHDDKHYYQPLKQDILKDMFVLIKEHECSIEDFFPYILPRYQQYLKEESELFLQNKGEMLVATNLTMHKNILLKIANEFNRKLEHYESKNNNIKNEALLEFFKDKKDFIKNFFSYGFNDFTDLFYFISLLRNPKMQYTIIKKINKYLSSELIKFKNYSLERKLRIAQQSLMNPPFLDIMEYSHRWIGLPKIHIKFCKEIFNQNNEYQKIFSFLEEQFEFETI